MLFKGEPGVSQSANSYKSYHRKCSFGWKSFRTHVTAEGLPVILSRLFPRALGKGLLFIFGGRLTAILEIRVLFVFR